MVVRTVLLVLAVLSVSCALLRAQEVSTASPRFHTSRTSKKSLPLPAEDDVFHFVVYGDRTGGPAEGVKVLAQAVTDTNLLGPDLVMTVGDLIQGYNQTDGWLAEMTEFQTIMAGLDMPWFPVAGNHDIYWRGPNKPAGEHEANYEVHFGPLWYWFEHKNTGFVVLYSDEGNRTTGQKSFSDPTTNRFSDEQLAWLKRSLGQMRDLDHVLVFLHHPKWIPGRYAGNNWDRVHELFVAAGNVRAVFAGHIHRLHYTPPKDGIEYFALATTGGHLRHELPAAGWLHHMNVVSVRKDDIDVAIVPVGAILDPREFTQALWNDVDLAMRTRAEFDADALAITPTGAVDGAVKFSLRNAASRPLEVTYGIDVADASWRAAPDHGHVRLDAGEATTVELRARRDGAGFGSWGTPELFVDVEYLATSGRVALPRVTSTLPLSLRELPRDVFDVGDGALRLRGRSDSVSIPSDAIELPDGPFTLETWMYADSLKGRTGLVAKTEGSEYGIFVSDGQPTFSVHLDGRYVNAQGQAGQLEVGRWHHVAGVFDGANVQLFVDGRRIASTAGQGKRTRNGLPLFVGADVDRRGRSTSPFRGWLDEVRLSTTARYTADFEPSWRVEPDADTHLLLHCDRGVGPFLPDHAAAGRHGRMNARATIAVPPKRPVR